MGKVKLPCTSRFYFLRFVLQGITRSSLWASLYIRSHFIGFTVPFVPLLSCCIKQRSIRSALYAQEAAIFHSALQIKDKATFLKSSFEYHHRLFLFTYILKRKAQNIMFRSLNVIIITIINFIYLLWRKFHTH